MCWLRQKGDPAGSLERGGTKQSSGVGKVPASTMRPFRGKGASKSSQAFYQISCVSSPMHFRCTGMHVPPACLCMRLRAACQTGTGHMFAWPRTPQPYSKGKLTRPMKAPKGAAAGQTEQQERRPRHNRNGSSAAWRLAGEESAAAGTRALAPYPVITVSLGSARERARLLNAPASRPTRAGRAGPWDSTGAAELAAIRLFKRNEHPKMSSCAAHCHGTYLATRSRQRRSARSFRMVVSVSAVDSRWVNGRRHAGAACATPPLGPLRTCALGLMSPEPGHGAVCDGRHVTQQFVRTELRRWEAGRRATKMFASGGGGGGPHASPRRSRR